MKMYIETWRSYGDVLELLKRKNIEAVKNPKNADIVLTYGGDGTILNAVKYEKPIFAVHAGDKGYKTVCKKNEISLFLDKILNGKYWIDKEPMLDVYLNKEKVFGVLNEVNLHHFPMRATRFKIYVNGKDVYGKLIGDGIIVATHFGKTGYYKSIVNHREERLNYDKNHVAIAPNNIHNKIVESKIVSIQSKIKVDVLRDAQLVGDNYGHLIRNVSDGDRIFVKKSDKITRFVKF